MSASSSAVPVSVPRHVCLAAPTATLFETNPADSFRVNHPTPGLGKFVVKWPHPSVSLSRICEASFKRPVADLVEFSLSRKSGATSASAHEPPTPEMRMVYERFSSARVKSHAVGALDADIQRGCLVPHGNLMKEARALDKNYVFDYPARPYGVCLRFINASGTLRVSRPDSMRILVAERGNEHNSWSAHRSRILSPVVVVSALRHGAVANIESSIDAFAEKGTVHYSTQRREPDNKDSALIEVGHGSVQNGEMDVEARGNVEYTFEMHNVSATVYVRLASRVTALSLSDLTGLGADLYIEYMDADAALAMDMSRALTAHSGVEAMGRYLGVGTSRVPMQSMVPSFELWPFEFLQNTEKSARAEALAAHLTMDTKNGIVFFRDQPLVLRTLDNVVYTAFLMCEDARSRLPFCYFVRRSAAELKRLRNPTQAPFRLHTFANSEPTNVIVKHCLDAPTTKAAMARLAEYFGTPLLSYMCTAPIEQGAAPFDVLSQLGTEMATSPAPEPMPEAEAEPMPEPIQQAIVHVPPPVIIAPTPPTVEARAPSPDLVDMFKQRDDAMEVDSEPFEEEEEELEHGALAPVSLVDAMSNVMLNDPAPVPESEPEPVVEFSPPSPPSLPVVVQEPPRRGPISPPILSMDNKPLNLNAMLNLIGTKINMAHGKINNVTNTPIALPVRKSTVPLTAATGQRPVFPMATRVMTSTTTTTTTAVAAPVPTVVLPAAKNLNNKRKRSASSNDDKNASKRQRPETPTVPVAPLVLPAPPRPPAHFSNPLAPVVIAPPPTYAPTSDIWAMFGGYGRDDIVNFISGESSSMVFPSTPAPMEHSLAMDHSHFALSKPETVSSHWESNVAAEATFDGLDFSDPNNYDPNNYDPNNHEDFNSFFTDS